MTSKERFLKALSHQKPDRPPFNFWMDRPLMKKYEEKIGHRHWRVTHFGADVIETFPNINFSADSNANAWETASEVKTWNEIKSLPLPNPKNPDVYNLINDDLVEFPDTAVILDMITPWGFITTLRGYENVYMDMYDYPKLFHETLRKFTDILIIVTERACDMGISALYLMEDLADRNGLTLSPAMIEEFVFPYAAELAEIAHKKNIPVLFHSDGNVTDLLDLLLPLGIKAINPLQPHLNNFELFINKYENKLAVYGGLDNCFIIPDGSPDDVKAHVLNVFNILGKPRGGLIFSTHDIPEYTPEKNVEVMIDTIKNHCIY